MEKNEERLINVDKDLSNVKLQVRWQGVIFGFLGASAGTAFMKLVLHW
jgi:hypothetical protein